MANGAPGNGKNRPVKKRAAQVFRLLSRMAVAAMVLVVATLVSIQFAHIVNENVAMARSLSSVQKDIGVLAHRKRSEQREIRRLMDPQGAVPEIHDRLHLVGPNETIIYVKPPRQ
jgi:cell division protein FtsB